jgi:prevent-host-death family protein
MTRTSCITRDTLDVMGETDISIRELRNHGGEVVDRVAAGERLTVTRSGKPVAELRPLGRPAVRAEVLLERWRQLPRLDADQLRQDVDAILDPSL